jgi:hypothetical protein
VKRFPLLLDAIANGELHLTGLLLLGPHLTPENHLDVLARAKFRTKNEIAKLVRELHPLPRVPDVMEPLGPELQPTRRNPSWGQWMTSFCPPVRELQPGEQPKNWANDTGDVDGALRGDTSQSGDLADPGHDSGSAFNRASAARDAADHRSPAVSDAVLHQRTRPACAAVRPPPSTVANSPTTDGSALLRPS